jgi:chemotaxis protein MotA
MSGTELNHRTMILDAILSIQAGDNPRVLAEKLESFVAPADRGQDKAEGGSPAAELREAA